ncbi:MAG: hypothetical protein IPM23_18190 [Candidatus Melainabacteria bacterium]|nr:hypothetical protein [Candidatus Melainabacteria bacterium]
MSSDTTNKTKDIQVLQLLTNLVNETDKLVRLADDIDTHATTPQAKAAFNLIGTEVDGILTSLKTSLGPLYRLYELDPGMRKLEESRKHNTSTQAANDVVDDGYDEEALWADVKSASTGS